MMAIFFHVPYVLPKIYYLKAPCRAKNELIRTATRQVKNYPAEWRNLKQNGSKQALQQLAKICVMQRDARLACGS